MSRATVSEKLYELTKFTLRTFHQLEILEEIRVASYLVASSVRVTFFLAGHCQCCTVRYREHCLCCYSSPAFRESGTN